MSRYILKKSRLGAPGLGSECNNVWQICHYQAVCSISVTDKPVNYE
jgi:hypothetical protein